MNKCSGYPYAVHSSSACDFLFNGYVLILTEGGAINGSIY